jgi:hypothetical protein
MGVRGQHHTPAGASVPIVQEAFRSLQFSYIHIALFTLILCFQNFLQFTSFRVLTEGTVLT